MPRPTITRRLADISLNILSQWRWIKKPELSSYTVQLIINLKHARLRSLNYSINISIYFLITCEYSKDQWHKHICVATNYTLSALVWNSVNLLVNLSRIYSYGVRLYVLIWSALESLHCPDSARVLHIVIAIKKFITMHLS